MTKAVALEQCDEAEPARRANRNVRIGQRVLDALGVPPDLLRVQVRRLWDRRYRVNIFVGAHIGSAQILKSYFLATDDDGEIIAATPQLKRQYDVGAESPGPVPVGSAARG